MEVVGLRKRVGGYQIRLCSQAVLRLIRLSESLSIGTLQLRKGAESEDLEGGGLCSGFVSWSLSGSIGQ